MYEQVFKYRAEIYLRQQAETFWEVYGAENVGGIL